MANFLGWCEKRVWLPILAVLILTGGGFLHGKSPYNFTRYTIEDGLSQGTIVSIYQDSRGFMWFGTQDGLNRFDGYQFKIYKNNPTDSTSISHNWVWSMAEDSAGYIWLGTFAGGLNRYDPRTDRFTKVPLKYAQGQDVNSIRSIYHLSPQRMILGTSNGVLDVDRRSGKSHHFTLDPQNTNILDLHRSAPDTLLLLGGTRIYAYHLHNGSVDTLFDAREFSLTPVREIWLKWLSLTDPAFLPFEDPELLRGRVVNFALTDAGGHPWVATRSGLVINAGSDGVQALRYDPFDPASLSADMVMTLFRSSRGEIWVGTRYGLNYYNPSARKFRNIVSEPRDPHSLTSNHVLSFAETGKHFWVGTGSGLNRIERGGPRPGGQMPFRQIWAGEGITPSRLRSNYVLSLLTDRQGRLWVGTRNGGLSRLENPDAPVSDFRFKHFVYRETDTTTIGRDVINIVYQDRQGTIWAGGGGLNRWLGEGRGFRRYRGIPQDTTTLRHDFVFSLHEDRHGLFWVGTASALHLMNRDSGTFYAFSRGQNGEAVPRNNTVLSILENPVDGRMWFGTGNGLFCLERGEDPRNPRQFSFRAFYERDGLPNEVIYGMLADPDGNIWISTNRGVARVRLEGDSLRVRSYGTDDGLQGEEFNQNGFYTDREGYFYFGGINGYNYFRPEEVRDNPHQPRQVITDFRILNASVPVGGFLPDGRPSPLREVVTTTERLELGYRDQVLSFEFASLDFTAPRENRYAYRLEGFDKNWVYSGSRRFATYTNLDPGQYVFRVKGSNNDGIWNETGTAIELVVYPPPWRTWWAYSAYALLFVLAMSFIVRQRTRAAARKLAEKARIEKARLDERERVRQKSSADFHDEAGNLITKINLFLELAKRDGETSPRLSEFLQRIEENTRLLSSGMRDFIWILDPDKDSLSDTLMRLKEFGSAMFAYSDSHFQAEIASKELEDMPLSMDERRAIIKIFKEAMNNALKYARAGEVFLKAGRQDGGLYIVLSDNGVGLDEASGRSDSYGLSNMKRRAAGIGATLEITGEKGKGTEVRLVRPLASGE